MKTDDHCIEIMYCKNANNHYPRHTHLRHFVLGLILDGEVVIESNGVEQACTENDYFVVTPNTAHMIKRKTECYSLMSVCLNAEYVFQTELESMLERIQSLMFNVHNDAIGQISEKMEMGLIALYSELTGIVKPLDTYVEELREKIILQPEMPFAVDEMAQMVCVSKYHLIRTFKIQLGLSPHQFQLQQRIRKSRELLLNGMSVSDAAAEMGFCDQSHFDKHFKRSVGMTPTEYVLVCKATE